MALRDRLEKQTKDELLEIRRFFSVDVRTSVRKAELIDAIENHLLTKTEDAIDVLPEYELRILQGLCHLPKGHVITISVPYTPFFLEMLDLLPCTHDFEKREMSFGLDDDFREAMEGCIDLLIVSHELDGAFAADRLFFGMLSLYGVITAQDFFNLLDKNYSLEQQNVILKRLSRFAAVAFCHDRQHWCHPSLQFADRVLSEKKARGFDEGYFKSFPLDEILRAGSSGPWFATDLDKPYGKALVKALEGAGYTEEDLPVALNDIWMECQMGKDAKGFNAMVKEILEKGKFDSIDKAQACMGAIVDYSNKVPKWILGGQSSDEVSSNKPDEQRLNASIIATAEKMASMYERASAFPKVGRNDPCPCGSGLKYKNCHGKNQN